MRITKITVWQKEMPLAQPYRLSGGRLAFEKLDGVFVRIETGGGLCGWGEGCPWGHTYLPAHGAGITAAMKILAPALIGKDPRALDSINRTMDAALPGHGYAKSPLDMACWDILGLAAGMPLWQLLGGESARPVPVNSSIATAAPEQMIADIKKARRAGYRTHSAKIGGADAAAEIRRIAAITAALEEDENITFDINRAWTPAAAVQTLNGTGFRGWIEQPCETIEQCAHVAARAPQPVMLDECLHNFSDHLRAWQMRAGEGIKLKPNRVGGLTRARQIRDFALAVGWKMHIEDTGGSALADAAAFHLAASTPPEFVLPGWLAHAHLKENPVPGMNPKNGAAAPPNAPGIGIVPDEKIFGAPEAVYS